ncbi:MAG: Rrf2 family transcriptional regulator [Saprospiraceae bacterium]|nr:Rrf2 family transcriptional regulator [Saprospiraceae bacterium]
MFSKSCEYAIRAVLFIAQETMEERRTTLNAISAAIDSPEAFTAKILQDLVHKGIIKSLKGPTGGFEMEAQLLRKLKLADIVEAVDGNVLFTKCGLGLRDCDSERPCPLHQNFVVVRNALQQMMEQTAVATLAEDVGCGLAYLK